VPVLPLEGGHALRPAEWRGYLAYAEQLREADVLLAPMLSPHTGYPALEMAACGGLAVTNAFANKTVGVLEAMSDNIVAGEATVEEIAGGLVRAARQVNDGRARSASLRLPRDWAESLDPAAIRLAGILRGMVTAA
jgi:hypothetical protein